MCSGLSSATVSFQGRHIWREQCFAVSIMNASLHPVSTPRQMLMSQFFSGVPTDSIFFLILCSIGERMAQLSDVAKSQMEFCCCTKSLYCYHRSFLNSLVLLLFVIDPVFTINVLTAIEKLQKIQREKMFKISGSF